MTVIHPELILTFVGVAFVLTIVPGPDTAMVLRTSAAEGARNGVLAALGIGAGCLLWGALVALGLGALLTASSWAFSVLKAVGAAYLLMLGLRLLFKPLGASIESGLARDSAAPSWSTAWRRGFLTNILNPKVGVFYFTLLPQFLPAKASGFEPAMLLACIHVAIAVIWFMALAMSTARLRAVLCRPRVARGLDLATGAVFVGFSASLVLAAH